MKTVPMDQRTDMWLTWRKSGIGASESAAALNLSPYTSALQLWEEKTGRAFPTPINADMQRGIDLEDTARAAYSVKVEKMFLPVCGCHEKKSYILASFDGISGDKKEILEIKCPRSRKLLDIVASGDVQKLHDEYPHYFVQIQHQYAVNEMAENAVLMAYIGVNECESMDIPRDDDFIKKTLLPCIDKFWKKYVLEDAEPPLSDKDYLFLDDPEFCAVAEEWLSISREIKEIQEKEKKLRKRLINLTDDGNVIGGGIKMTRYATTRTDYKKACEDHELNLEPYKKTTIGYYRISEVS